MFAALAVVALALTDLSYIAAMFAFVALLAGGSILFRSLRRLAAAVSRLERANANVLRIATSIERLELQSAENVLTAKADGGERGTTHDGIVNSITRVAQSVDAQADLLRRSVSSSERTIRRYLDDVYDQLVAVDDLRSLLDVDRPLPALRRWAISPDLALLIVRRIVKGEHSNVFELGSGASTILFGQAVAGRGGRVVSIDHDADYASATRAMIREYGLEDVCEVIHSPLRPREMEGADYLWYDIDVSRFSREFDLMFVDGPPERTGRLARYPAIPVLAPLLLPGASVILDDGDRADEQEAAKRWSARNDVESMAVLPVERRAIDIRMSLVDGHP